MGQCGDASLKLHHPEQREVSMAYNAPWEGNVCCYYTVLRNDKNYNLESLDALECLTKCEKMIYFNL